MIDEVKRTAPQKWGPYTEVERLGKGGQGYAYRVQTDDGQLYVLKTPGPKSRPTALQRFKQEIETLKKVSSDYIIAYVDHDLDHAPPYVVMENFGGVDLNTAENIAHIEKMTSVERLGLAHQLSQALSSAHQLGIIHRDVKPANILLKITDGAYQVALIDFGICWIPRPKASGQISQDRIMRPFTKHWPVAPELLKNSDAEPQKATDIYYLGMMIYWIFTGRITHPEMHRKDPESCPAYVLDLLDRLLAYAPQERPTAQQTTRMIAKIVVNLTSGRPSRMDLLGKYYKQLAWTAKELKEAELILEESHRSGLGRKASLRKASKTAQEGVIDLLPYLPDAPKILDKLKGGSPNENLSPTDYLDDIESTLTDGISIIREYTGLNLDSSGTYQKALSEFWTDRCTVDKVYEADPLQENRHDDVECWLQEGLKAELL